MLDATIQIIDAQVHSDPEAEPGPQGGVLQLALVVGLGFPVGPNQIAHIPAAVLRANFGKERAESLGKEISDAASQLKPPSKLSVATDVDGAIQAAKTVQGFRDGPQR